MSYKTTATTTHGENLAEALIDSGMAVKYDGGKKNSRWCE